MEKITFIVRFAMDGTQQQLTNLNRKDETHQNSMTNSGNDANWSTDIQIRRLTAQLTAAYHRIAALEEQLLSHRIH